MQKIICLGLLGALGISGAVMASGAKSKQEEKSQMMLSIYSQNLAQVDEQKEMQIAAGVSSLVFEGVAEQMQPQTALVDAKGIKVLEKNYEYNLLNQDNLLNQYIGKEVKTVMVNPSDGRNIFDKAILLNNTYGNPLLKFRYGIEANFPGRVVFDKIPENLQVKPTLTAKVEAEKEVMQPVFLTYLTNGLSWSTNYVAELKDGEQMDLQAWVDISNQSGADYKNAKVTLISGEVNTSAPSPQPYPRMLMAKAANFDMAAPESMAAGIAAQPVGGYYRYELLQKVDVLNKQNKQVSLWQMPKVKFEKEYKVVSALNPSYSKSFEREHAQMVYKLSNVKEQGLGLPMPEGKVRFYEKDAKQNLQFSGEAQLPLLAEGEKAELAIGKSFDVYAEGQVVSVSKIAEKTSEVDYKISLSNATSKDINVVVEQKVDGNFKVVSETMPSKVKNAGLLQWNVTVPAESESVLEYKLRFSGN